MTEVRSRQQALPSELSLRFAPRELECTELRAHRAFDGVARDRSPEDPVTRLRIDLRGDRELQCRAIEDSTADFSGSAIAREGTADMTGFSAERDDDRDITLGCADGKVPGPVD